MSDNPLTGLSKEEQEALAELAKARVDGRITRRDMMKVGSLLGGGVLLGGGASQAIGPASAAASDSDSDGDIGAPGNRIDVFADGVDAASVNTDEGTITSLDGTNLQYKTVANDYHYAGSFDGADPDARLDNAITKASDADVIYLESGAYNTARTVSKRLNFIGTNGARQSNNGSALVAVSWTFTDRCSIRNVELQGAGAEIALDGSRSAAVNCSSSPGGVLTISADACQVRGGVDLNVTFESGTTDGIADGIANATVTDNGTNTIGDLG